jgi:hypothetical protein
MITLTTPTQQAMARIATAPATSEQARPTPTASTRLSMAACPMPGRCPEPCDSCTAVARTALAQQAMARIATAPVTSDQTRPTPTPS